MAKVSTSEERAFKWVATLFLAFVFMACLFESIDYQRHLRAQDDTIDWEPVNATVVFSEVVWENCGEEGCDIRPKIMYEYDVDGTTTVAERITFPWDCVSDDRLLDEQQWRVVDDFPVGANATAYVDPTNQEEAVLYVGLMENKTSTSLWKTNMAPRSHSSTSRLCCISSPFDSSRPSFGPEQGGKRWMTIRAMGVLCRTFPVSRRQSNGPEPPRTKSA